MKRLVFFILIFFINTVLLFCQENKYVLGHITTCTGLINNYPADSTNWFYRKNHKVVQYFAYILFPVAKNIIKITERKYLFINPYERYSKTGKIDFESNFVFENRWLSPSGKLICEKINTWSIGKSDTRITLDGVQYVPYTFANYIGISEKFSENGQEKLPEETGLYHIKLFINSEIAVITFFEMKD